MIALLLLLLALVGVPLFAVLALGALSGFQQAGLDGRLVIMEFLRIGDMPVLLALPLFTFAGVLFAESNAPARLMNLGRALPGGLVIIGLMSGALLTAFTGASGLAVIALGGLLLPALMQAGFDRRFSLGLVTTGGGFGVLFAPSLPLILYAVVARQISPAAGVGIDTLFLAGILPGLLMVAALGIYAAWIHRHLPPDTREPVPAWPALKEAAWELPLPFVVLGGIYSGWLLVTEAAVVAAAWAVLAVSVFRREVNWAKLSDVVSESMILAGTILVVLGMSLAFTNHLIDTGVPQALFDWLEPYIDSRIVFLLSVNVMLLLVGMVLNIFAAVVIMAPLIIPVALAFGVDPVHLGIIFLASLQIGYCIPPLGVNVFLASRRFGESVLSVYRGTLPFLLLLLGALAIITCWPELSLWLPAR